jgi:hypothetical protein
MSWLLDIFRPVLFAPTSSRERVPVERSFPYPGASAVRTIDPDWIGAVDAAMATANCGMSGSDLCMPFDGDR